jgi:hypothetical protein
VPALLRPIHSNFRVVTAVLAFHFTLVAAAAAQEALDEFWPEVKVYKKFDEETRIVFISSFSQAKESRYWEGQFGGQIEWAVLPVLRRDLRSRSDVFTRRYLSFEPGYLYVTSLDGQQPYRENRGILQGTARYLLPLQLLASDRNRIELRAIEGQSFSVRYRNKLQVEREFIFPNFNITPFVSGELFYDTRYDIWNRNRYSTGFQTPVGGHLVVKLYVLHQNDSRSSTPHVNAFGAEFSFYF